MAVLNDMGLSKENIYVYSFSIPSSDPNSLGFQDTIEESLEVSSKGHTMID